MRRELTLRLGARYILFMLALAFMVCQVSGEPMIPAFPGAEGGGAGAKGGRGGIIYQVVNLNDRGKGSLRYGLTAKEYVGKPRIIVFRVGGNIYPRSEIKINNDRYITIAGQTAPGDGITINGRYLDQTPFIIKNSHDIVIRFMRFRKGGKKPPSGIGDGLAINDGSYNIIVDHCSVSWAHDENIAIWAMAKPFYNITVQWTISSEGLNHSNHANALIAGSTMGVENTQNISIHHNFFAHQRNRLPLLKVKSGEIINNVIYDWDWWATGIAGGIEVDIIGNIYDQPSHKVKLRREIVYKPSLDESKTGATGNPSIYMKDNWRGSSAAAAAWSSIMEMTSSSSWGWPLMQSVRQRKVVPEEFRRHEHRQLQFPISIIDPQFLEAALFADSGVGASKRLNQLGEWVPNRDQVDLRLIRKYKNREGGLVNSVEEAGGWPEPQNGIPYPDEDKDGMSDIWELRHGLNPQDSTDANVDYDNDGYDNIEEFLNGTDPRVPNLGIRPVPPIIIRTEK